jgi:hypothetical protein
MAGFALGREAWFARPARRSNEPALANIETRGAIAMPTSRTLPNHCVVKTYETSAAASVRQIVKPFAVPAQRSGPTATFWICTQGAN